MIPFDPTEIARLAERLLSGEMSVEDFTGRMCQPSIADLGEVQVDLDRSRRCGFPEVIYAQDKPVETIETIVRAMVEHGIDVLATRLSAEKATVLLAKFPLGRDNAVGRTFRLPLPQPPRPCGKVAIVTAGTSDLPVAEEARETALWMGAEVVTVQDVGVAGPHRLTASLPAIADADAVVVVAGMEGACRALSAAMSPAR